MDNALKSCAGVDIKVEPGCGKIRRKRAPEKLRESTVPYARPLLTVASTAIMQHIKPSIQINTSYDTHIHTFATTTTFWLQKNDLLDGRYIIQRALGRGVFGQVYQAADMVTNQFVAIKCIRAEEKFAQQANEEIRILKYLKEENITGVVDFKGQCEFKGHMCLVFELLHINLTEYLRKRQVTRARFNQSTDGMPLWTISIIAKQLLQTLAQLAARPTTERIIHCDLKPDNIALQNHESFQIKLLDFGSACSRGQRKWMYIQSRSYRAPEIVLRLGYRESIDMWSLGCVLMQFYTSTPLFPSDNETSLMSKQVALLGMPPFRMIEASPKADQFFIRHQETGDWILKSSHITTTAMISTSPRKTLTQLITPRNNHADRFEDLIRRMLDWDPNTRITPVEALDHVFFRG